MTKRVSPLVTVAVFILAFAIADAIWPADIVLGLAMAAIATGLYMQVSTLKKGN